MRWALILTLALAACQPSTRSDRLVGRDPIASPHELTDSPLWPKQHQIAAEEVCRGSEEPTVCVAEVRAEREAAGRDPGAAAPQ